MPTGILALATTNVQSRQLCVSEAAGVLPSFARRNSCRAIEWTWLLQVIVVDASMLFAGVCPTNA